MASMLSYAGLVDPYIAEKINKHILAQKEAERRPVKEKMAKCLEKIVQLLSMINVNCNQELGDDYYKYCARNGVRECLSINYNKEEELTKLGCVGYSYLRKNVLDPSFAQRMIYMNDIRHPAHGFSMNSISAGDLLKSDLIRNTEAYGQPKLMIYRFGGWMSYTHKCADWEKLNNRYEKRKLKAHKKRLRAKNGIVGELCVIM